MDAYLHTCMYMCLIYIILLYFMSQATLPGFPTACAFQRDETGKCLGSVGNFQFCFRGHLDNARVSQGLPNGCRRTTLGFPNGFPRVAQWFPRVARRFPKYV